MPFDRPSCIYKPERLKPLRAGLGGLASQGCELILLLYHLFLGTKGAARSTFLISRFDTFFSLCYYICNKDQVLRTLGQYNWLGWFIPF